MNTKTATRLEFRTPTKLRTPRLGDRMITPRSNKRRTPGPGSTPGDRYIPSRGSTDMDFARFKISDRFKDENRPSDNHALDNLLSLQGVNSTSKALRFDTPRGHSTRQYWQEYSPRQPPSVKKVNKVRKLPKCADRVLDAPNLINDFYLNVLDWSSAGVLAVALRDTVYLLDTDSGAINQLTAPSSDYVASLTWSRSGKCLAVGTNRGGVQLWDVAVSKIVRQLKNHEARVGSLAWNSRKGLLSSGSHRGQLVNSDPRIAQHYISSCDAHSMDICGLKWCPSGRLLASGGNDNLVKVWDLYHKDTWTSPTSTLKEHTAAVKALSWCPWQPTVLASGGGSADKRVCVWNTCSGTLKNSVETGAQVSGLLWDTQHKELLSAHGNPNNQLSVWSCDPASFELSECGHLRGHEDRILHLSGSFDGRTVVTAGADETLRFWKVFSDNKTNSPLSNMDTLSLARFIR